MNCERIRDDLAAYAAGQLPRKAQRVIAVHLNQCPLCANEAAVMRCLCDRLGNGLKAWAEVGSCPPDLENELHMAIRSECAATMTARTARARGLFAMAGMAAVFLGVALAFSSTGYRIGGVPVVGRFVQGWRGQKTAWPSATIPEDRWYSLGNTVASGGLMLEAVDVSFTGEETVCLLRVRGVAAAPGEATWRESELVLHAGDQLLPMQTLVAYVPSQDGWISFAATFGPVPRGVPIRVHLIRLAGHKGPWELAFPRRRE